MAEAFGLAAGVLQVAGFGAEVSSTLFKCAKKFHNASKELEEIASQVETTSISLRRVDALLKDPTTKALHTQKLYDDTNTVSNGCFEIFHELENYVKSFDSKPGFGKMAFRSKVRWSFDSSKVHGLGQVLRRYSDVLHLMISVMAIVEGRRAATKDELQTLEADLKLLALSNKDLSHSNKTLTDTIAAISRAPISPVASKARSHPIVSPVTYGQGTAGNMPVTMLFAMPPVKLPPITPRNQHPSNQMTDHLQRCMKSVQELAMTISCALNTLQGREKIGSSDVHGSYEKLSLAMSQLSTHVQCDQCKQSVAWSHFQPARSGMECKCIGQIPPPPPPPPPPPREPCSNPMDSRAFKWGSFAEGREVESGKISIQRSQSPEIDKATQSVVRYFVDPIASIEPEAHAYQKAPTTDASSLHAAPLSSSDLPGADHQYHGSPQQPQLSLQVPEKNRAALPSGLGSIMLSKRQYPRPLSTPTTEVDQGTAPLAPPLKPAQDSGDSDNPSSGNKPTHVPSEPGPFVYGYGNDPAFAPDQPRLPGPFSSEFEDIPMTTPSLVRPRQGGRKKNTHLSQEAKDRCPKMRKLSTVRRRGPEIFEPLQRRRLCNYDDDLDGNQQRHQEQNKERHPTPDNVEHLDSVVGGSPDGESFDLDLDLADSAWKNPPNSYSIYWEKPGRPEDTTHEATTPLTHVGGGIESLRNPYPSSPSYRQHMHASTSNYQASQHWPTQTSVSPGAHQAQLADLEAQNKKRLLKVQRCQEYWSRPQAIRALPSNESSAIQKKSSHSVEEMENIKNMMQPAPPEPDQPATSTPLKAQDDSDPFVEGEFGLNMDFADVSAGGGVNGKMPRIRSSHVADLELALHDHAVSQVTDLAERLDDALMFDDFVAGIEDGYGQFIYTESDALDNFDFDSLLNMDDRGMSFDFPEFDGGLKDDGVGSALDHTSHAQDTENAPQHSQKRSHSDALPGSPKDTPFSQCRKRRATSLSPRTGKFCKSPVEAAELSTTHENNEISNDSPLGVEALLQRWFDASATAVLLKSSDG